ncbi:3853_t:CDS:1, partial [Cetraspora pellucida]
VFISDLWIKVPNNEVENAKQVFNELENCCKIVLSDIDYQYLAFTTVFLKLANKVNTILIDSTYNTNCLN